MSLGVLGIDIDKLLQNRITIPSSYERVTPHGSKRRAQGVESPTTTPRYDRSRSSSPRNASTPTSVRKNDCYLIKGDDGSRVWSGMVLSPSSPAAPVTPRHKSHQRRRRDSSNTVSISGTPSLMDTAERDDERKTENNGASSTFAVRLSWTPNESYRHTSVAIIPLQPTQQGNGGRPPSDMRSHAEAMMQGGSGPPPLAPLRTDMAEGVGDRGGPSGIMTSSLMSRPGSGSSVANSRVGSANTARQGSARKVRVIGHDDVPADDRQAGSPSSKPPLPTSAAGSGGAAMGSDVTGNKLSCVAQDIIDTTLSYVQGRVQLILHPPCPIPQPPTTFRDAACDRRLLRPKGCTNCTESPRRRAPHNDLLVTVGSTCTTDRQRDLLREKERRLCMSKFKQGSISHAHCPSLPGTLSTYRPPIQGKQDPMVASVFDLEYVKPPRAVHAHKSTAERRSDEFSRLSPAEHRIASLVGCDAKSVP